MSLPLCAVTVRPVTVTARQDLSETEKERPRHPTAAQNVLLGGHVVVLSEAEGCESLEDFILMWMQQVGGGGG